MQRWLSVSQKSLKAHLESNLPTWRERGCGERWPGPGPDPRVGSYLSWTQSALIEINHRLTFMEMPQNSCGPSLVFPRGGLVWSSSACIPGKMKTPHSRTPEPVLKKPAAHVAVFGQKQLWSSLRSWLANITITPGSRSRRSAAAKSSAEPGRRFSRCRSHAPFEGLCLF